MRKLTITFIVISIIWLSMPQWALGISFNAHDLGSQSFYLIFIWGAYALIRRSIKQKEKKQAQKLEQI